MRSVKLRDSRAVGDASRPYIIAEVNTSHSGDVEVAKKMILQAKESGCDCVKFQSWSAGSINSKTFYDQNPISNRIFKKFSLSEKELIEVAEYCRECGIAFSSTPYSKEEVDFLINECDAPFVKVASMDLTNYMYLDYIARTGVPIVLSTGMGEIEEIRRAVETIEKAGNNNISILHCISIYPPELSTIKLKNIVGLREEFPNYPIGFSDHSIGIEMAVAAIALGACMVEKHLTLDKNKIGMDNQIALEPDELAEMTRLCHNVYDALGDKKRVVLDAEIEQREKIRRSVIVTRDLKSGSKLRSEDLDVKRPGTGIPPEKMAELIGKELLRDVEADTLINLSDIF